MAMDFESTSGQVVIRVGDDAVADVALGTFMAWVRLETLPSVLAATEIFLAKGDAGASTKNYYMGVQQTGDLGFCLLSNNGTGSITTTTTAAIAVSTWTHLACSYDGTDGRMYINGVQDGTPVALAGTLFGTTVALNLARRSGGGGAYDGMLDDVRIYDRAMSAAEIATVYASRGNDGILHGLVARYLMREASVGTAATVAGSVKDLTKNSLHLNPSASPVYAESRLMTRRAA
jgi:hypothetical protein